MFVGENRRCPLTNAPFSNSAALYEQYTNRWTIRDEWRVQIPLSVRRTFADSLAWAMHCYSLQELSFDAFEDIMNESLGELSGSERELQCFKSDLQVCSFLTRSDRQEAFRFAHKSFLEYFVARKLMTDLLEGIMPQKPERKPRGSADESAGRGISILVNGMDGFFGGSSAGLLAFAAREFSLRNDFFIRRPIELFKSDKALANHLENHITQVLKRKERAAVSTELGLSDEIATFAVEYAVNSRVRLRDLVEGISNDESIALFCDLMRLSKSGALVQVEADFTKRYILSGDKLGIRVALCSALARCTEAIDVPFLKDARVALGEDDWSYFLFEVANREHYGELVKECWHWPDLRTLDRLICLHGMHGTMPKDSEGFTTEPLVLKLLESREERERLLGFTLCRSLSVSHRTALVAIGQAFSGESSGAVKEEATRLLATLQGNDNWQYARSLWSREKDMRIKELLKQAERTIRAAENRSRERLMWDTAKADRALRDRMWKYLGSTTRGA